ncbi:thioredoxin domain-containing protein [bacterium]|jgi:uncharacterized protein|nr:thioredoxin domain-containing protein [bacterium]
MSEQTQDAGSANRLLNESSPYLLQHAYNPVDWFPWGDEAFEKARQEEKPIFLSVGYSACHWCHVMEHESFENDEIAQILNEHYVSIKVDREERPDVDQIYMTAVQLITKRGGWPMSVFMTPDGKPFYGGTYWPPTSRMGMPGFRDILFKLADFWTNKRDEVDTSAEQLVDAIQGMSAPIFESMDLEDETILEATRSLLSSADQEHGGFGAAPKFPHPMDIRVLLRGWKRTGDQSVLDTVTLTLNKMLHGGIYDQLGGGFHRYSTDAYWLAPHFEKMLYDNALLVPAYLEAWQVTGQAEYHRAVTETLDYVLKEMTSAEGGFFSTQDADTEGEEGKFFVWSEQEIAEVLGQDQAKIFNAAYDVSANGNWEGKNILNRPKSFSEVADQLEMTQPELNESLNASKETLLETRAKRVVPGRDEKILVSWNGLMLAAMAKAGFAFDEPRYLAAAEEAAKFLIENLRDADGKLQHSFKDGIARFQAYVDDFACLIDGLVDVFQSTGDEYYLQHAVQLAEEMIEGFWDEENGGFYYTANDHESLIARTKDIQDNAVPSGNGMAATALIKLGRLCNRQDFIESARKTIDAFSSFIVEHPRACGQSILALDDLLGPQSELVVISGEKPSSSPTVDLLRKTYLPRSILLLNSSSSHVELTDHLVAGRKDEDLSVSVYVCSGGECQVPAETVEQLQIQLSALL